MERALVCGGAARRVWGRPSEAGPSSALPAAATCAGAPAAGRSGSGGRDLRGGGVLLRGARAAAAAGAPRGRVLSSDATSRAKASAGGGSTDGVGLRRLGFDRGLRPRGDSSESFKDCMLSSTA